LLAIVNLLNLADALLTEAAVEAGIAVELNPLVEVLGVPGKLAVVAGASCVIAALRPRALIVPIAVLVVVVGWSAGGLLLTA
jgi:hypothetical protein